MGRGCIARKHRQVRRVAVLRAATSTDATAVATVLVLSRRAFLPYAPSVHAEAAVHEWVATNLIPGGGVTVWHEQGDVVALVAVSRQPHCGWIDQLYVLPGFERRGFGSRLLQHAHGQLQRPVRLYAFQQNHGARRFYERHGYRAIAFTDGRDNEERCPDVLYELGASAAGVACESGR
jgi:GNAT superfamily N-acetyltransferase